MAYFKLSLLTSQFDIDSNQYKLLEDVISEFNTQENVYYSKKAEEDPSIEQYQLDSAANYHMRDRKYSFCYSYNEKLSLTQNAQKTLSFNLDKYIIKENLREENPFARNIIIDTQLLLIDQYNNNYFFTVKGIDYDIKETNITYKITCQDTFSYQATRLNAGYTIDNDPSESDFIGAKTVDWWTVNKIIPECHLSYDYIYMNEGLYESTDGSYKIFNYGDNLTDVKRIIKDAYSPDKDKDLYETIPFSCSGSNANAALIALGETLDLQLKTFEHLNGIKYFWFEPKKNTNRIGGLVYSPYNSIQSFGLGHKGDSLTTILNVEGPTYDDEIITLIPELTPHFANFFQETSWDRNNYHKGMFLAQCEPQHYYWNNSGEYEESIDENYLYYTAGNSFLVEPADPPFSGYVDYDEINGFYYIQLFRAPYDEQTQPNPEPFKLNSAFTIINFDNNGISKARLQSNGQNYDINSNNCLWSLVIVKNGVTSYDDAISFRDGENYKDYLNLDDYTVWIKIFVGKGLTSEDAIDNFQPNLSFSREVSEEDIEFARAAEECPWLENKLIDFSYFLESHMITQDEYRDLMNILTNNIRVLNGKIMFYAKAYYKALHERTKLLADLTNQLDALGAAANADIVTTLRTQGEITAESDITSFDKAYTELLVGDVKEKTKLLNYDDILTDYFNKYFNAEQRFLKNIKNFKDYFNSAPSSWLESSTAFYKYTLSILQQTSSNDGFYVFNNTIDNSELISAANVPYITSGKREGTPCYPIYYQNKLYTVVTAENYKNYYIDNPEADSQGRVYAKEGELYNSRWDYFMDEGEESYFVLKKDIEKKILGSLSGIKERKNEAKLVSFVTTAIPRGQIRDLMKNKELVPYTHIEYSFNFPVTEVFDSNGNKKCLFVNNNNYNDFYKLRYEYTWKTDKPVRYDVFQNRLKDENNKNIVYRDFIDSPKYIYCSKTAPKDYYKMPRNETIPLAVVKIPSEDLAIGYNYAFANGGYFKETSWFKTVFKADHFNIDSTYRIFEIDPLYDSTALNQIFNTRTPRGTTTYWPIYNLLKECELIGSKITDITTQDVENILSGYAVPDNTGFIWTPVSGSSCPFKNNFIIVELLTYQLIDYNATQFSSDKKYYTSANNLIIYDNYLLPTDKTYYHVTDAYIHPDEFNINGVYYKKEKDDTYSRARTVVQLNSDYKYVDPYSIQYNFITPYETKIDAPIVYIKIIRDAEDSSKIIDFQREKATNYTIYFTTDAEHSTPLQYYYSGGAVENNEIYPLISQEPVWQNIPSYAIGEDELSLKLTKEFLKDIDTTTNGDLWYLCKHGALSSEPFAVEISASIEAQLEQFWQQAYTASLYCRYFLPESWQLNFSKDQNLFNEDIIGKVPDNVGPENVQSVYLKNTYLPEVSIYSENGKTVLPKYFITRGKTDSYIPNDKSIDRNSLLDTNAFKRNPVILEVINHLGDDIDNFTAAQMGTTTYYYIKDKDIDSGCTWSRLMANKVGSQYYKYSGLYDLSYYIIKNNYLPLGLTKYEELQRAKQIIWDTLYRTYGYLMLENNYKNETATTSSELMTLAKYAFKDYSAPERQYNITVIDATSLKGYKGEEIRVGDGIQIDAQAYYNEYDQIFKSLSQYLFITDISYTLRSPTDISLTVNSIKYQDKLIQRLVKLIK